MAERDFRRSTKRGKRRAGRHRGEFRDVEWELSGSSEALEAKVSTRCADRKVPVSRGDQVDVSVVEWQPRFDHAGALKNCVRVGIRVGVGLRGRELLLVAVVVLVMVEW